MKITIQKELNTGVLETQSISKVPSIVIFWYWRFGRESVQKFKC